MSIRCSVYIATSLDGFIAKEDGNIDWLNEVSAKVPKDEDMGYYTFMDSVDALVMGRNTYEKVLSFGGDWPYKKSVIVLSRNKIDIPEHLSELVTHSSEAPKELCTTLEARGYNRLYIDGGVTIQRFISAGMLDDMIISIAPVVLGTGIPLFGKSDKDIQLKLIKTKSFDFGFVQLTYDVVK